MDDSSQLSSWDPTATVPSSGPGVAVEEVENVAPPGLEEFYDAEADSSSMLAAEFSRTQLSWGTFGRLTNAHRCS